MSRSLDNSKSERKRQRVEETSTSHDVRGKSSKRETAPAKLSAAQKQAEYQREAVELLSDMKEGRLSDASARRVGQPPLHRLGLMKAVAALCRRSYMHRFLVEEGILQELSYWLYDLESDEPGPLDLRSGALELLMSFEVRGMNRQQRDEEGEFDERKAAKKIDDLDAYRGICREDLEGTTLGIAVNRLRTHSLELERNKILATQLLQRLSRAFQHKRDDEDEAAPVVEVQWRCKGDSSVAPPFDPIVASSDAFQQRMFQPDPQDPMSYLRVPPKRYNKGYVTNLGHIRLGE